MTASTIEARILISAADQASRVFGVVGGHARELAANIEKTGRSFTLAKQMATGWNRELESTARVMRNTGLIMTGAISAPIGLFAKSTLAAAKTHVEAQAHIRASLRSTGREVEFTAKQLGKMAEELSAGTTFDDKEILEGTNALLKFGRVHGTVFERAQKAAVDLAAAQHMEVKEAAETLGVALQDPEKAGRKLRGIGIVLSEFQKAQIHNLQLTGQTAKAQGIIMDAVAKAFAGQAKELAGTPFGQMTQFKIALNEAKEALGEDLAEALQPFIVQARDAARGVQHLAEAHTGLAGALAAMAASAGPALTFLGQLGLAAFALQGPLKGVTLAALAFARALWPLGAASGVVGLVAGLFKLGKSHESAADRAREQAEALGLLKGKLDGTTVSVNRLSAAELARQRQIQSDKLTSDEKSLRDKTGEFAGQAYKDIGKAGFHGEALSIAKSFSEGKITLSQFESEIVRLRGQMAEGTGKDFLRQFIDESVNPALKKLMELEETLKRQKKLVDEYARAKPAGEPTGRLPRPPAASFTSGGYAPSGRPREAAPLPFSWPGAGGSRSFRNNNPGNLKYGDFARSQGATGADAGGYAIFPSVDAGTSAQRSLWGGQGYSGLSVEEGARKWSGGSYGAKDLGFGGQEKFSALPEGDKTRLLEAQRRAEGWSGGSSIPGSSLGSGKQSDVLRIAETQLGLNEIPNQSELQRYFATGVHAGLNPAKTAWCAAFVGASLNKAGLSSLKSNIASSYANYGTPVKPEDVRPGDIGVQMGKARFPGQVGGHIGIMTGEQRNGLLGMVSGNKSDAVRRTFERAGGLTIRRPIPPSAGGGSNLADMFALGGGRLSSSSSQVEIGKGTVDLNVSVDGPGKISGIKPQASGNFAFGDITVDRVGQRFARPSGLR